jgi:hypothetical protein
LTRIRFFTDEDVYGSVAPKLRERGLDAISTPEAKRLRSSDDSQLEWAVEQGRVFLTFNVGHFARLHHEWVKAFRQHAGIVVSSQRTIGDCIRRVLALAAALSAEDMRNRLEYLGNW